MSKMEGLPPMELSEAQRVEDYDFDAIPIEIKGNKKPKKETKAAVFVKKINNDNIALLIKDVLEENAILRRQADSLRNQNNNILKEYNEFRVQILNDRMTNLGLL